MRRPLVVALLAALLACSSPGGTGVLANLRGPQALVLFMGVRPDGPADPVPLIAVAASRGDELRIIDPSVDRVVSAPNLAYPLAVPTLERPLHLGAASLGDGGADVLTVASGGQLVQLVATWRVASPSGEQQVGVVSNLDLEPFVGRGSQILSMVGAPVPAGPGTGTPPIAPVQTGRAWVLIGLSPGFDGLGGKLAVLEFARQADGSVALAGPPVVKVLGFSPVALTSSPDVFHVYAASRDFIPDGNGRDVLGVAELDASGGIDAPWPVRGLDGLAPTSTVAAALLGERISVGFPTPPIPPSTKPGTAPAAITFGPPVLRVYATLDPSGCGLDHPIACGVATFDPALGGLAPDPAPPGAVERQPYRTPLFVPAIPFAMGVAMPPSSGPTLCVTNCFDSTNEYGVPQPLMELQGGAPTLTTASLLVTAADGRSYLADLGRYAPTSLSNPKDSNLGTKVVSAAWGMPTAGSTEPGLGVWVPDASEPFLSRAEEEMLKGYTVWPGFTPGDRWQVTWQGVLPGLTGARAVLGKLDAGNLYVAFQSPLGSTWVPGVIVGSPSLGIHPADAWSGEGDLALFLPDTDPCPIPVASDASAVPHEAMIESILPPDAGSFPGGALRIAVPAVAGTDVQKQKLQCLAAALSPGETLAMAATVRASGLVLVGQLTGYAGRPRLEQRYELAWHDERGLAGEELILARKARRFYYPSSQYSDCDAGACPTQFTGMTNILQPGPVVGFRLGTYCSPPDGYSSPPQPRWNPSCPGTLPVRGAAVQFSTQSGVEPAYRVPYPSSEGTDVIHFDKSLLGGEANVNTGQMFYVTYVGGVVLMFPPSIVTSASNTIR